MDTGRINAAALLLAHGAPQRPALVCGRRSVSYGELVMLRGDYGIEHVVAFLGAMWAGAVPVPLRIPDDSEHDPTLLFALDATRSHPGEVNGHGAVRWMPWDSRLADLPPSPEVDCEPGDPACWTEPRNWSGGSVLVLPHRFALVLSAQPGVLPLTPVRTMLGALRALRRGTTVILQAAPR